MRPGLSECSYYSFNCLLFPSYASILYLGLAVVTIIWLVDIANNFYYFLAYITYIYIYTTF